MKPEMIAHYRKYLALAERLGIRFNQDSWKLFGLRSIDDLRERYLKDENLNNIPLTRFDSWWIAARIYVRSPVGERISLSMSDGVCIAKTLLIIQVLGIELPKV